MPHTESSYGEKPQKATETDTLENKSSDEDEDEDESANQSTELSTKDLKEMCELATKLESYSEKENSEQMKRWTQQIRLAMAPLQERLKEKQTAKQPLISNFFLSKN
jgi:hypothetical protein